MSNGVSESVMLLNAANAFYCTLQRGYAIVCIGLLGFRFSATYAHLSEEQRLVIIIGFILFTAHNFINIRESRIRFNTTLTALQEYRFHEEQSVNLPLVFSKYNKINTYVSSLIQIAISIAIVYIL